MKVTRNLVHSISILLAVLLLAACNLPGRNTGAESDVTDSAPPADSGDAAESTDEAQTDDGQTGDGTPEANDTPAPADVVSAPVGWSQYTEPDLGISLYMPPGWEANLVSEDKLDIRETDGFAWLEINIITTETDDSWSVVYTPGTAPNAILSELVVAAQDDGDFDEPYDLSSGAGDVIWATQGVYDVLEEPVFIGAVDQSDRLLLVLGHALPDDDWGGVYLPLYESMIQTITRAN